MTHLPTSSENHQASPRCPAIAIAARDFPAIEIDFPRLWVDCRTRSESVSAIRFTGETSSAPSGASSTGWLGSAKIFSSFPVARLMILFETTPCRFGFAPVTSVVCPAAVTVSA